jgi:hypothetical protein
VKFGTLVPLGQTIETNQFDGGEKQLYIFRGGLYIGMGYLIDQLIFPQQDKCKAT